MIQHAGTGELGTTINRDGLTLTQGGESISVSSSGIEKNGGNNTTVFTTDGGTASLGNYATTASVSQAVSDATFNNGHNAVSSVAGIPVSKRLVIATISNNGSFTLASTPADGHEIHVIVHNTNSSDIEITMPSGSNYVKMSGDTLTVAGNSYADINVISDGTNMYIRALLETTSGGGLDPSKSAPCDLCFYDKQNDKVIIVSGKDWSIETYPADRYTPIGVVVVPGIHNVYGDGSCGVMSLKEMNCDTPSTGGTSAQAMYWGVNTNISGLPDLDQVPTGNTPNGIPTGSSTNGHIPSDNFSGTQCAHDTDAYYDSSSSSSSYIPSPYLTDGSRNPGYYQTSSPSSSDNALADFDGIGNTEKIITKRGTKDYNSWTPGRTTVADYPAASCCDMFYTEGTSQGDWYLPACGELGYIMPSYNKINDAIDKMRTAYGSSVGVELDAIYNYWSSTAYSSSYARYVFMNEGYVGIYYKGTNNLVRAWLRVGGN